MTKIKIDKNSIIALALCISFIPVYAIQLVIGNYGYLALVLILGMYIIYRSAIEGILLKSFMFLNWIALMFWMMLCSYIGGQGVIYSMYYVGKVALWFLANDWFLSKGSVALLKMSRRYVGILIVATFIQQLVAPGIFGIIPGSGNMRTLFASDNFLGYYYTAYIALCFVLDYIEIGKTRIKSYLMIGVCMGSIIIAWAVKNVIGIGVLVFYVLFVYKRKLAEFFGPRVLLILFVGIFLGTVFLNIQQYFYDIAGTVFGKTKTFSVRYYLWTQAVQNIQVSPIFGYGIPEGGHMQLQYNFSGNARSSHNLILELAIQGGVIGVALYFLPIIKSIFANEGKYRGDYKQVFLFLTFNVFLFFLIQLGSGSIYYPFYYMPIILIDNLGKLFIIKEKDYCCGVEARLHCHKLQQYI